MLTEPQLERKRARHKERYATDSAYQQRNRERAKKWRNENPDKAREIQANWRAKNPERRREHALRAVRKRLGIPAATRPAPPVCECCGKPPRGSRLANQRLHLDHDHTTGKFRGWLCSPCNLALGMLGDDFDGVAHLVQYLNRASIGE